MLKIQDVSKSLGTKQVLDGCTFSVEPGSITGLIGINGAGKTTLLRCIAGIYTTDNGTITLEDEVIYENEAKKQNLLFLSDELYYERNATMKTLKSFYQSFYPTFNEERYNECLQTLKLDESEYIRNFSKGMKRQAFIIIMLAIEPKVLLLDESFDGLDPVMKSIIKKAITSLVLDKNSIVLISSHSLNDLELICDHYVMLNDKKIELHKSMDENYSDYHRFQLAFEKPVSIEDFKGISIIKADINSQIATIVAEGNIDEIERNLELMNPLMSKRMDLSLEELFLSKMEE